MSRDLYMIDHYKWAVRTEKTPLTIVRSADEAAPFLEAVGVLSDEIDFGIQTMLSYGHSRAHFGDIEGTFIMSDEALPNDSAQQSTV